MQRIRVSLHDEDGKQVAAYDVAAAPPAYFLFDFAVEIVGHLIAYWGDLTVTERCAGDGIINAESD